MRNKTGILVISDALELRKFLRQNLEARGFLVSEACEEADGLETIDGGFSPQLVIADMDELGMESFRAGVTSRRGGAIRVVAVNEAESGRQMSAFRGAGGCVRPFGELLFEDVMRIMRHPDGVA